MDQESKHTSAQGSKKQRSCAPCAAAKRSCDHDKPFCGRCVSLGITSQCVILSDGRQKKGSNPTDFSLAFSPLCTSEYISYTIRTLVSEGNPAMLAKVFHELATATEAASVPFSTASSSTAFSSSSTVPSSTSSSNFPPKKRVRTGSHTLNEEDADTEETKDATLSSSVLSPSSQYLVPLSSASSFSVAQRVQHTLAYFNTVPMVPTTTVTPRQLFARMDYYSTRLYNVVNIMPAWPHDDYLQKLDELNKLLKSLNLHDDTTKSTSRNTTVSSLPSSGTPSTKSSKQIHQATDSSSLDSSSSLSAPPVPDDDPFEAAARVTIASIANPVLRVVYEEPDLHTLVIGSPLKIKCMYFNYSWAEITGTPLPARGRLAYILSPQNILSHVHHDDRKDYLRNITKLILLRSSRGSFRARFNLRNGWTYADEISDISYYPSGCVRMVTITYINIDPEPCIHFPKELVGLRQALAQNRGPYPSFMTYTPEGDAILQPDIFRIMKAKPVINKDSLALSNVTDNEIIEFFKVLQMMLQQLVPNVPAPVSFEGNGGIGNSLPFSSSSSSSVPFSNGNSGSISSSSSSSSVSTVSSTAFSSTTSKPKDGTKTVTKKSTISVVSQESSTTVSQSSSSVTSRISFTKNTSTSNHNRSGNSSVTVSSHASSVGHSDDSTTTSPVSKGKNDSPTSSSTDTSKDGNKSLSSAFFTSPLYPPLRTDFLDDRMDLELENGDYELSNGFPLVSSGAIPELDEEVADDYSFQQTLLSSSSSSSTSTMLPPFGPAFLPQREISTGSTDFWSVSDGLGSVFSSFSPSDGSKIPYGSNINGSTSLSSSIGLSDL